MKHRWMFALAALAAAGFTAQAHAEPGVKVGALSCDVSGGWGVVFGSSKDLDCSFTNGAHTERYTGTINKFGVDIGYTHGGVIVWAVFAPTAELGRGALAGNYGGATASATAVVGAGANALVGGSNNTISLQPLSIEGNTGLNVAAGVASISLQPAD
jgi:hypothetical protein